MECVETVELLARGRKRRRHALRKRGLAVVLIMVLTFLVFMAVMMDVLFALALFGGPVLLLMGGYVIWSVLGGRKTTVLYLRRFGLVSSSNLLTAVLDAGLSKRYRVVTLDDSKFAALEVPRLERILSRFGPPFLGLLLVFVFLLLARRTHYTQDLVELFVDGFLLYVLALLVITSLWALLFVFTAVIVHRVRVRRRSRATVASEDDLRAFVRRVVGLSSWARSPGLMAPQTTVVSVSDALWKRAVALLATYTDAVLIDVSEPTDPLLWELEQMFNRPHQPCVLVGDQERVRQWQAQASTDSKSLYGRIASLLDGRTVLLYRAGGRRAARRAFKRNLLSALDNLPLPTPRPLPAEFKDKKLTGPRVRSALAAVALYTLLGVGTTLFTGRLLNLSTQEVANVFVEKHHWTDRLEHIPGWTTPKGAHKRLARLGLSYDAETFFVRAEAGDSVDVALFLLAGMNPDTPDTLGWTALTLAAVKGHTAVGQALLDHGADVHARYEDRTALTLAVEGGHTALVEVLLDHSADVDTRTDDRSLLMIAAARGDTAMAKALLRHSADVQVNRQGHTALMLAAVNGRTGMVQTLLDHGADVQARDYLNHTALAYASFNGHNKIVQLLRDAGAKERPASRPAVVEPSAEKRPEEQPGKRARFAPSKPHVNLGMIGDVDHGKNMVTAALTWLWKKDTFRPPDALDTVPEDRKRRPGIAAAYVDVETDRRHYAFVHFPRHLDYVKGVISSMVSMDATILVVAATDGPTPQTREQLFLAQQAGVPYLVAALNRADEVPDEERLDAVEADVRALLNRYGFPGDEVPVVRVSALGALRNEALWRQRLLDLMAQVDAYVPVPSRDLERPFLMPVEDVFTDPATRISGRIERGIVKLDDPVEIVGIRETRKTWVTGIALVRKRLDEAEAGDGVGLILQDVDKEDVERGQVIAAPGSISPHVRFEAMIYLLTRAEGGRARSVQTGYRPQIYFRTTDVTGGFTVRDSTTTVRPGDYASVEVELTQPVALESGDHFAIREGGRTTGVGVIVTILE